MKFEDAKEFLYQDGSWRDVYALKTTVAEMNAFLDYVRPMLSEDGFHLAGNATPLPKTYLEVLMGSQEATSLLRIPVGPGYLNCHFFDSNELELDFVPADYSTPEAWDTLSAFLQGLADAMQHEVLVTPENMPEVVYIRYQPLTGQGSPNDDW